ncbi:MAG: orotidine-5'-phosphate decarboxylase [Pseudomonadales bacterium]
MDNFADRLIRRTRELGHPLCVGLDPYLERIPPQFRAGSDPATILNFFSEFLPIASRRIAIVKPQISLFERFGIPGLEVLQTLVGQARSLGLIVLLDAKRGDIGETARGYADAYLSGQGFIDADAVTVNPYMGLDAIEPFVDVAASNGKGVVVLVRNSNPGSDRFQLLQIEGRPLFEVVALSLQDFEARLMGESGWSSLTVTVSARAPADSLAVRRQLPRSLFLVLGYGTQGGDPAGSVAGLTAGPNGLEGGMVNSSRAVLYPDTVGFSSWEKAIESSLADAIGGLRAVI